MTLLKQSLLVITIFFTNHLFAQLNDLARIDYTTIPANDSDIGYSRLRGLFNYPIKLKKEGEYLLLGLDYSNIDLRMNQENFAFDKKQLEEFQILDLNIGFTKPLKNDWRLGIRLTPGFSSNLKANNLSLEDVIISGDIVFIKDKKENSNVKKPWRLIVGISYSGNGGFSYPLPFISYYRKFNLHWSYNIGIPKTNLQYHISNKNRLKLFAQLDGFTSNLQKGVLVDNTELAKSINMSLIVGGLQYEYHFANHFEFYARSAYILSNQVYLRDENKKNIKPLDNSNSLYLRTGIRLKF